MGNRYIVLDDTSIYIGNGSKVIGNIATQNQALANQSPIYEMGTGIDSGLFAVNGTALMIKPSEDYSVKTEYTINTTSTGDFGTNNFRMVDITVTGASNGRKWFASRGTAQCPRRACGYHNHIRLHLGLPACQTHDGAADIRIEGANKWKTLIQAAGRAGSTGSTGAGSAGCPDPSSGQSKSG